MKNAKEQDEIKLKRKQKLYDIGSKIPGIRLFIGMKGFFELLKLIAEMTSGC